MRFIILGIIIINLDYCVVMFQVDMDSDGNLTMAALSTIKREPLLSATNSNNLVRTYCIVLFLNCNFIMIKVLICSGFIDCLFTADVTIVWF